MMPSVEFLMRRDQLFCLWYLEELVGGPTIFEPFLKAYFQEYTYKSLNSDEFKEYFLNYFKDTAAVKSIDWDTWYYKPGMPPYKPNLDTSLAEQCWELADMWCSWDKNKVSEADSLYVTQVYALT